MGKYRKKPVEIEAIEWTGKNVREVYSFMHGAPTINGNIAHDKWDDFTRMHEDKPWVISTLEATEHSVTVGDFVIKGIRGEFYSCKPDIFAATYDPVAKTTEQSQCEFISGMRLPDEKLPKVSVGYRTDDSDRVPAEIEDDASAEGERDV